eukprot:3389292-Prymnesium_polylepis.2
MNIQNFAESWLRSANTDSDSFVGFLPENSAWSPAIFSDVFFTTMVVSSGKQPTAPVTRSTNSQVVTLSNADAPTKAKTEPERIEACPMAIKADGYQLP